MGNVDEESIVVARDNKYGYIDQNGTVVIPLKFDFAEELDLFEDPATGLLKVKLNGKYGALNRRGEVVIPFEYDGMGHLGYELIIVKNDDKYGYVNREGKVIIPLQYEEAESFQERLGLMAVKKNGKYGVINIKNEVIAPFEYDSVSYYPEKSVGLYKDGVWFYVDEEGEISLEATR